MFDALVQFLECARYIALQVDPQCPAPTFAQHGEVAERLCLLQYAKGVGLSRDRKRCRVVRGELKEDARVRAALVELARGVQEARAIAERRRNVARWLLRQS